MILPLACIAVSILVDGSPVRSYRPACIAHGRVLAPVVPFVIQVAGSVEYAGGTITVRRGDLFAQTADRPFVEIGPLLRTLGIQVTYEPRERRVSIRTPHFVLAEPTPFNPAVPRASPSQVFTPAPVATPKPVVSGKPAPRRTPLPLSAVRPLPSP